MHAPRRIALHRQIGRGKRPLFTDEDIEVVVRSVHSRMALCSNRRAEHDKVLGDAGVDNVHGTHRAARVVEHPLLRVWVECYLCGGVGLCEVGDDVRGHESGIIGCGRGSDRGLGKFV